MMSEKFKHSKNVERFTQTLAYYSRYRPSYPKQLIDLLIEKQIIHPNSTIADIGSGTGLFTQPLLETGALVLAVEPNTAMREFAQSEFKQYPNFRSINGMAENTTLKDASVDVISVATAFHWFDYDACQKEFKRILKPDGWVILLWNLRQTEKSSLLKKYDDILKKYNPDYKGSPSDRIEEKKIIDFFLKGSTEILTFDNPQRVNLDGLIGRLRSSSQALTPKQPGYEAMIEELTAAFHQYAENNSAILPYLTKVYLGKLE